MEEAKLYLSLLIEEYKTVYNESLQAVRNIFTTLQIGTAILGVVIAAGLTQWNKEHGVVLLTFYIVIPLIDAMIISLWLGAVARIKKAADYQIMIEQKVGMILDQFKLTNEIRKKWPARQKKIEEKLKILPHSQVDLSDPFAWQQLLKEEWFMKNGEKYSGWWLVWLGYRFYALFFPIVMVFSFLTATYYVRTHPEYLKCLPCWLSWLINLMPVTDWKKVTGLVVLSIIIIIVTIMSAGMIWKKKLNVKIEPIHRSDFPNDESFSNNG